MVRQKLNHDSQKPHMMAITQSWMSTAYNQLLPDLVITGCDIFPRSSIHLNNQLKNLLSSSPEGANESA